MEEMECYKGFVYRDGKCVPKEPWEMVGDEFLDAEKVRQELLHNYFKKGLMVRNPGKYPAHIPDYPVGAWKKDRETGEIEQLQELPLDLLLEGEKIGPESIADVEQYRKWLSEGRQPPRSPYSS